MNYKISLRQAVEEFIKKEAKVEDFTIIVEEKNSKEQLNKIKANIQEQRIQFYEEMDDCMYSFNFSIKRNG